MNSTLAWAIHKGSQAAAQPRSCVCSAQSAQQHMFDVGSVKGLLTAWSNNLPAQSRALSLTMLCAYRGHLTVSLPFCLTVSTLWCCSNFHRHVVSHAEGERRLLSILNLSAPGTSEGQLLSRDRSCLEYALRSPHNRLRPYFLFDTWILKTIVGVQVLSSRTII